MRVPSPAAISLLHTSLLTTPGPLVGPARPYAELSVPPNSNMLWSLHQVKLEKSVCKALGATLVLPTPALKRVERV
jgi:hypothetical protein